MRRGDLQWGRGDRVAAAGQLPGMSTAGVGAGAAAVGKAIAASRSSGILSLTSRGLSEVPQAIYSAEDAGGGVAWWEVQELTRLDLSRNEIVQLPEELFEACTGLTSLDLSLNKLISLPPGVGKLEQLRSLALSGNPLGSPATRTAPLASHSFSRRPTALTVAAAQPQAAGGPPGAGLPEDVGRLPALASLACADCGLASLPDGLGDARTQPLLAQLLASGNRLMALPLGLARASALVKLELQGNALSELDGRMVLGWSALKELDLSNNQLRALPSELGTLSRLETLRVRQNQLESLPAGLASAAALVELHAGFNRLTALPDSLGALPRLAVLDVRNNRITEFPSALCTLPLTLLDLSSNDLRSLPAELGSMSTLRALPLDGNPLKLIRRELWAGPLSALLEHLRSRAPEQAAVGSSSVVSGVRRSEPVSNVRHPTSNGGSSKSLSSAVPQPFSSGSSSSSSSGSQLVMRSAQLSVPPMELSDAGYAAQVSLIDLSDNRLTQWPLPFCIEGSNPIMPALKTLDLRGNPLQAVPYGAFTSCPNLTSLDLSGCPATMLEAMPVGTLPSRLEVLAMAGSRLQRVPWEALVAVVGTLQQLDLSSNSLSDLPPSVSCFRRLETLDLTNNALTGLPFELGRLAPSRGGALRTLRVQGNCIRTVRRSVLEGGTATLLDYLASRLPDAV